MPFTREFWSAAMLLRWVLTRDEEPVLKMLDDYGAFEPSFGGTLVRTGAETWQSVASAYSKSFGYKQKGLREGGFKLEEEANQRKNEINAALCSGQLRSWVSRNKSADLVPGEQAEWTRRQFLSVYGHDLAVPIRGLSPFPAWGWFEINLQEEIGGEDKPLFVPSTVWMDPAFSGEDAQNLWPPVTNGDFKSVEDRFVKWMKAQKEETGRYPPRSRTPGSDRPGFEEWAHEVGIGREVVRDWVSKHCLSHGRGAPRKDLAKK